MNGISFSWSAEATKVGDPYIIQIVINNQTDRPISSKCRIHHARNRYFEPTSVPIVEVSSWSESEPIQIKLFPVGGASLDRLCSEIVFELKTAEHKVIATLRAVPYFSSWSPKEMLKEYKPDPKSKQINILVFGLAGSGKSALIQSFLTCLHPNQEIVRGGVVVGGAPKHVTTNLRRIDMSDLPIAVWDTWGLDAKNYACAELKAFIQGSLPSGWNMYHTVGKPILLEGEPTAHLRQIHAVIFVVPYGALDDEEELISLKSKFEEVVAEGINPILLLGRIDLLVPGVRENPFGIFSEIENIKRRAAKEFNIPSNMILPCVPYIEESERKFDLDRLAFKILDLACKNAVQAIKFKSQSQALDYGPASGAQSPSAAADGEKALDKKRQSVVRDILPEENNDDDLGRGDRDGEKDAELKAFLKGVLKDVKISTISTYASKLAEDGFDSVYMLKAAEEKDLVEAGMLKGHLRMVLKALGKR